MNIQLKVNVKGIVQGVGFRWSSYEKFVELGLTGKAENTRDGGVEINVTGERAALDRFVEWAQRGPSGARVEKVDVSEVPPEESTKPN